MQQFSNMSLHAAAWFFVGNSDEVGEEKTVPIKTPFRIGRNPDSDLYLKCASVSGSHAEIVEENGDLWLKDLNSTNGTFVNGDRIQQRRLLTMNDTVQFGTAVFHVNRDQDSDIGGVSNGDGPSGNNAHSQSERFERLFSDGVVPFFQPIIQIDNDEQFAAGYEVLGRSRLFGLRTPAQMFAAASRMEMEAELSRVLRKQGIEVADKNLPEKYSLFVNTHPAEMECDGLEESLFEIRDHHPDRPITLEVHESVLEHPEKFLKLRATLQNIDIQLAFHDFGSGQIRMAELCEVVPDVVKFDISLVRGIDRASSKRQQFVAAMVKMVKDLGITPMAECVEQENEHETLKQLGFQLGQGFYYGRPCSIADCGSASAIRTLKMLEKETSELSSFLDGQYNDLGPTNSPTVAELGQPKDAEWLLSLPPHHYTIQVLSAISEESAIQHIARQEHPEDFAIFCKQGKTRKLFIVVHGVFDNRADAKSASAKFANGSVSPWIRMLSSVQAEIEA
jgi:EAL domain-containing protein (putative c-di-GMP-specific phosphodiesterase class I)